MKQKVIAVFFCVLSMYYCYQLDNTRGRSRQLVQNQKIRSNADSLTNRYARFLSLFTVVQFPNGGCMAQTGENGTCLTPQECRQRGGLISGNCANGFGVCCVFMVSCGGTTRENQTYFVNQGYPNQYDGTSSCQINVLKSNLDVCQFRLDFDQLTIMGPEPTNNICNNDQFIVSGSSSIPTICGTGTGNHMYVDAGLGLTNPVVLSIVTTGPSFPRNWKIRITQIPCFSPIKAEEGCLQYYSGVSGQITSFNYDLTTGLQLSNQDYSICIRKERNFCGIQYTQCPDIVNNRTQSFTLSGNTASAVQAMVGTTGQNSCPMDYIIIACASNVGRAVNAIPACQDRMCGGTFSAEVSLVSATVQSSVKPFRIVYHTDATEAPQDIGNRGFCLNYIQQPCTNTRT